jgi:magnesium-protoporphyrin IX monomethyl ester (oxidative) cyclase
VLYNEIRKNVDNPDIKQLMTYLTRDESRHAAFINLSLRDYGLGVDLANLKATKSLHLLQAQVHLLRDLPVREDRLRALHHHLPPARAPPRQALPPDLSLVRTLVQRRVPARRVVRADDARQPAPAARRQPAVGALLPAGGVRHDVRARPHAADAAPAMGLDPTPTTTSVFDITTEITARCSRCRWTPTARFRAGLVKRLVECSNGLAAAKERGGVVGLVRQAGWAAAAVVAFVRLYTLPVKRHDLPAQMRVAPAW